MTIRSAGVLLVALAAGASALAAVPGAAEPSRRDQLVYTRSDHGVRELVAVDGDGTHAHVLWPHSLPVVSFAWRGSTVTYSAYSSGRMSLYAAGRPPRRLTTLPGGVGAGSFDWSPDGNAVVFTAAHGITTLDLRDRRIRVLVRGLGYENPKWSPDGARIAFVAGGRDIVVVDADGRNSRTVGSGIWGAPAWSPDGTRIAFGELEEHRLFVVPVTGGPTQLVTSSGADCFVRSPSWAPHAEITFTEHCSGSQSVVEEINADGSDRRTLATCCETPLWSPAGDRLLTQDGANLRTYDPATGVSRKLISPEPGSDDAPHWSRDGTKLAFSGVLGPMLFANGTLRRWPPTGADVPDSWAPDGQRIAVNEASDVGILDTRTWTESYFATDCGVGCFSFGAADWSPDGRYILVAFYGQNESTLHRYDVKKRKFVALNVPVRGDNPAWAPDGRHIAYDSSFGYRNDDKADVFVANADGSGSRRIATHASSPAWSRDSKRIAFVRTVGRGNREIFVMNPDGSNQRRITHHPGDDIEPDWR